MKLPRYSAVELLLALILLFATAPFIQSLPGGELLEAVLLTVVLVSSVVVLGGDRRSLWIAIILLTPTLISRWANHFWPSVASGAGFELFGLAFFSFVIARLLTHVIRAPQVDRSVLCAAISGFLMLGMAWALAYLAVARSDPAAFNFSPVPPGGAAAMDGLTALYFSFITLCTVGYGDITPVSRGARMLAVLEAVTGLFYMTVLVSRLVSIYTPQRPPSHNPTPPPHDPPNP